jgi:hypothetical protein
MKKANSDAPQQADISDEISVLVPYSLTTYGYVVVQAAENTDFDQLTELAERKYWSGDFEEECEEPKPEWLQDEVRFDIQDEL